MSVAECIFPPLWLFGDINRGQASDELSLLGRKSFFSFITKSIYKVHMIAIEPLHTLFNVIHVANHGDENYNNPKNRHIISPSLWMVMHCNYRPVKWKNS